MIIFFYFNQNKIFNLYTEILTKFFFKIKKRKKFKFNKFYSKKFIYMKLNIVLN